MYNIFKYVIKGGLLVGKEILLSAAIVSYNCSTKTLAAAKSILDHTKIQDFSLYIIDNNSDDKKLLENIKGATLIENTQNSGFGGGHNKALELPLGKYHAVINPDIEINEDVLKSLTDIMEENPDIVMLTPKILNPDGSEQKLPKRIPNLKYIFLGRLSHKIREEYTRANEKFETLTDIDFCTGCFFVIRSEVFKKIGGFDERFFMYMEDADLSRQAKKYGRVVFCPYVCVTHIWERASAKSLKAFLMHITSVFKYLLKWRKKD